MGRLARPQRRRIITTTTFIYSIATTVIYGLIVYGLVCTIIRFGSTTLLASNRFSHSIPAD